MSNGVVTRTTQRRRLLSSLFALYTCGFCGHSVAASDVYSHLRSVRDVRDASNLVHAELRERQKDGFFSIKVLKTPVVTKASFHTGLCCWGKPLFIFPQFKNTEFHNPSQGSNIWCASIPTTPLDILLRAMIELGPIAVNGHFAALDTIIPLLLRIVADPNDELPKATRLKATKTDDLLSSRQMRGRVSPDFN
ncbi:uncharacterized protein BCR38DRAFT_408476 [Pseudomassariella vexata]|uniref:Uncharacterized protein n=1 Tax=Pseudomassariella vexata TaxID=1141098 RepID=A0A1Y2E4R4_9PEZI|nr:uncharacterized protein BCR38DRAFT_408476 [Pseudomassariella vexata]ORY66553.1 hypothetical protein BCR38DRAFT_408476 [Pseudomassariella vexata]